MTQIDRGDRVSHGSEGVKAMTNDRAFMTSGGCLGEHADDNFSRDNRGSKKAKVLQYFTYFTFTDFFLNV
jgi:hypothetical protein